MNIECLKWKAQRLDFDRLKVGQSENCHQNKSERLNYPDRACTDVSMKRVALVSRSLVPRSLPVLGLAPISLRANGHDPAEATRQRLLTFKVHMSCRHCATQLASFGRLLVFGPWAAQPSVESAGGMEGLPRWTAEGCAPAATSTTWPLCGTSSDW